MGMSAEVIAIGPFRGDHASTRSIGILALLVAAAACHRPPENDDAPRAKHRASHTASTAHTSRIQLGLGEAHACAIGPDESVRCWGSNILHQVKGTRIGSGSREKIRPTLVTAIVDPRSLAAGSAHTCALQGDGELACWGNNMFGELGDPTSHGEAAGVVRSPLAGVRAVTGGGSHGCALLATGHVACWGSDGSRQLGASKPDATMTVYGYAARFEPSEIPALDEVVEVVAGGEHTCARRRRGDLRCWGAGYHGQLGRDEDSKHRDLVTVPKIDDATQLALGQQYSCALREDRSVWCWGRADEGQLGDGGALGTKNEPYSRKRSEPHAVEGITAARKLSAGGTHACIVDAHGEVWCWGGNRDGQLGDGSTKSRSTPARVTGLPPAVDVACGRGAFDAFTCAVDRDDGVWCWGSDKEGQLGDGGVAGQRSVEPVKVRLRE